VKAKQKVFDDIEASELVYPQAKPETESSGGSDEEAATIPENGGSNRIRIYTIIKCIFISNQHLLTSGNSMWYISP
jgi:hypothetical protein